MTRAAGLWATVMVLCTQAAAGQTFAESTRLLDIRTGGPLSDTAAALSHGGYDLSDGTPIRFSDWYHSDTPNLSATWLTQTRENLGFFWGFGTGESGPKYDIDPSLKLGFVYLYELPSEGVLSFSASTRLAGRLRENTCTADYGAIGGVQDVNCRLAATPLPPDQTLQHLLDIPPPDRVELILKFTRRF